MKGNPEGFWGKLDKHEATEEVLSWHPLAAHCADVAACAEALLETTLLRRRLATLAGRPELTESDVARLAALAALHDIGKFNHGFQRKSGPASTKKTWAGHVQEAVELFAGARAATDRMLQALPSNDLVAWSEGDGAIQLLTAAVGHHGRPVAWGRAYKNHDLERLWRVEGGVDPFAGIADLVTRVRAWFPAAFESSGPPLPSNAEFQHAFAGLVMLADWLGSDRAVFPFAEDHGDRMSFARPRALEAVAAMGLDARVARATLGGEPPAFSRISDYTPHEAQRRTLELPRPEEGSLVILESETGSGKTEAALARYLRLFQAGLVDGLVFALPTRSAATQLHGRVHAAVERAFPDRVSRPPVVLAVPGYLRVDDDEGKRLPGFDVLWQDDDKQRARHRGWAAENAKRYLAGAVVVGTVDQVLLSSLRVSHAHLRATALLRQLLVVDEVHASDTYMTRVLQEVLAFHLSAGGHALLMSATLGTDVRRRLERAALGAQGENDSDAGLSAACVAPYPVVRHATRGRPAEVYAIAAAGRPKEVDVRLEAIADEPEVVAARGLAAARAGARVLVLRNTVADAVATQRALETLATAEDRPLLFDVGGTVTLHTSRFSRDDRGLLDAAIDARFGKKAPPRGGVVAVCTQTVQQSLDLDADILFTDLAPMDVLLQRLGRVHRHPELRDPVRPAGFERPVAVVMLGADPLGECLRPSGQAQGKHGVGTVYDDALILEATRQRLAEGSRLRIPAQNRELVEVTTHPEALAALATKLGGGWEAHRSMVWGKWFAAKGLAEVNRVDRSCTFGGYTFETTDLNERIASRLGESDRRARFDPAPLGPFGTRVRELTIPGWMIRREVEASSDPDLAPTDVKASAGPDGHAVTFSFGPLCFVYDRLGLRAEGAQPAHAVLAEGIVGD